MEYACASSEFYLTYYTVNASSSSAGELDYESLPSIYDANGEVAASRDSFESDGLCDDDGCTPTSGGSTCDALACLEVERCSRMR